MQTDPKQKPPESDTAEQPQESDVSPSAGMTPAQKAIFYPGPDMPNPPSEPE